MSSLIVHVYTPSTALVMFNNVSSAVLLTTVPLASLQVWDITGTDPLESHVIDMSSFSTTSTVSGVMGGTSAAG